MLVIQCEYELESLKYFNYYSSGWYCSFPQLSLLWLNLRCFINPIITLLHNQDFLKSSIYYKKKQRNGSQEPFCNWFSILFGLFWKEACTLIACLVVPNASFNISQKCRFQPLIFCRLPYQGFIDVLWYRKEVQKHVFLCR